MNTFETMVTTMSDADLHTLWACCANEHKRRRKTRQAVNKGKLKAGDTVYFQSRRGKITGTIKKVKRVKALVECNTSGLTWDVSLGALSQ